MPASSVCGHILADSLKTMEDIVLRHYRYVAEIKMKAEFEGWCGPTNEYRILM